MAVGALLRDRNVAGSGRVGMVELFFDLVFVFAVTQLSHKLLAHLTLDNLVQVTLLFLAVWWVWMYTAWTTNWLDPERIPVRICLFALTVAGLFLSVSIPSSFAERGIVFACSYVSMQVGRTLFVLWGMRGEQRRVRNFQRIGAWLVVSGVIWIYGALADPHTRLAWWALALGIEVAGPWAQFWLPGLGRSSIADWDVDGGHMSERCALFVIIALGESLLVTGATFAELTWDTSTLVAFFSAVFGSILMWWIYFDTGAERAHHRIVHAGDPGRTARSAYSYVHVVIVAGIVVCAVADERSPHAAALSHDRSGADRDARVAGADAHDVAADVRRGDDDHLCSSSMVGSCRAVFDTNCRACGSSMNSGTSKKRNASSQSRSESAIVSADFSV
jgi:low temperature requirement protein LtrA